MGIINSLLAKWGYSKAAASNLQGDHGSFPMAMAGSMRWNMPDPSVYGNQADMYRTVSWIGTAISILAKSCASVTFSVKRMRGEDTKDIVNHPFELRLQNPNPLQSRSEFLETCFSFYPLNGNNYIWLNRENESSPPDEMWIIPPDQIIPVPDARLFIKGYDYTPASGVSILIPPHEIVHNKSFNPRSPFVGLSLIESLANQAYGDLGRTDRENKLYNDQNGSPPSILAFADNYSDKEWNAMQNEIEERAAKMKRYLLIRNTKAGGVNWIQTAMSNKDMEYLETRRFTKEEIFDRIAPGLSSMLAVNATEANSKSGKATFSEFAQWPLLDAFAQKITAQILPAYGLKLMGEFDDIRVKERALELQEMGEYAKTHTIEEVRQKFYQDDPIGDERDKMLPAQITTSSGGKQPEPEMPPQPSPAQPTATEPDNQALESAGQSEPMDDEAALEVKRWKRVARKALKAGKSANVNFVTDIIPVEQQAVIRERLEGVKTSDEIEAAFVMPEPEDEWLTAAKRLTLAIERLVPA